GTTAELHGHSILALIAHGNHTDHIAEFLAEQRHSAPGVGLLTGQLLCGNSAAAEDEHVHQVLYRSDLRRGHGSKVGEVKAQEVGLHQRTGLLDVVSQNLPQGSVEEVGSAVGPAHCLAALTVNGDCANIP